MKLRDRRKLQEFLLSFFLFQHFNRSAWHDEELERTLDHAGQQSLEAEYVTWWNELTKAYHTTEGGMRDDVPVELIDAIQQIGCDPVSGVSEQLRELLLERSDHLGGFPNHPIAVRVPRNPMNGTDDLEGAVKKEHIRQVFSRMPDVWHA